MAEARQGFSTSRRRGRLGRICTLLGILVAVLVLTAGCVIGPARDSNTTQVTPLDGTVEGFESFSGMVVPDSAENVELTVSADEVGEPVYFVAFDLPAEQVDQFCLDGHMQTPLPASTIPAGVRKTFGYAGNSSSGVSIAKASLPSYMRIQREVFTVGTNNPVAHVQVHAYKLMER